MTLNFPTTVSSLLHIREILVHWPFLEVSGPQKWVVGATLALKQNFLAGTLLANRINDISNHTRQIYDLHCLCNSLVVKIPMIKVCNPSPFRKTILCDVIDEAMLRAI